MSLYFSSYSCKDLSAQRTDPFLTLKPRCSLPAIKVKCCWDLLNTSDFQECTYPDFRSIWSHASHAPFALRLPWAQFMTSFGALKVLQAEQGAPITFWKNSDLHSTHRRGLKKLIEFILKSMSISLLLIWAKELILCLLLLNLSPSELSRWN